MPQLDDQEHADDKGPALIISAIHHVAQVLDQFDVQHVVSILSAIERRLFAPPDFGGRSVLRLEFDDSDSPTAAMATHSDIAALIDFARAWRGGGALLCHCHAGSSRSPAAAMIAAAAIGRTDRRLLSQIARARSYFRPNLRMLHLADSALAISPTLVQSVPPSDPFPRRDRWSPVRLPLGPERPRRCGS